MTAPNPDHVPNPTHSPKPELARSSPPPGTAVRDTTLDRVGIVMGHKGPYLQLRPLSGGRVWDADPDRLEPLTPTELLRVRLAETNARSRQELGIHRPTGEAPPPR